MRAVVAVLLFVTAVHAAMWGVLRDKQQAPDFTGMLPSVSYAPFERGHIVDIAVDPAKVRADLKKLSSLTRAVRLYTSTDGVELVPPIAAEFGLKVTVGAWIDTNIDRNEREIDRGHRSRPAQQQCHRRRRRQRDDLPRRAEGRRSHRADQAGQEIRQRSGHDRRNLEHLARQSAARLLRRFHRRARPALLGKLHRQAGRRPGGLDVPTVARPVPGQADHDRGVRLAERRLQSAQRRARPVRAGHGAAQLRHPRRSHRHGIQHRRGDRSALEILRRRRRPLLGHSECRARAEILLDRADRQPGLLEACDHRRSRRHPDVAADPAAGPADRDAGACCCRRRPTASAPGPRPCSPIGPAITSCSARPLR